ncbi:MAG: hypothetical protein ACM3JH_03655 [Acidithiobacillales bacterium]
MMEGRSRSAFRNTIVFRRLRLLREQPSGLHPALVSALGYVERFGTRELLVAREALERVPERPRSVTLTML